MIAGRRRLMAICGGLAGIALGLYARTSWLPGVDGGLIVGDLAVGWLFIGCGLGTWLGRPRSRIGPLMVATGAAWFAGTILPEMSFLHRGPLFHLLATYPSGRLGPSGVGPAWRPPAEATVIATVYVASALPPSALSDRISLLTAVTFAALAATRLIPMRGGRRRSIDAAGISSLLIAVVLATREIGRSVGLSVGWALLAYEIALTTAAIAIAVDSLARRRSESMLARVVVDLGESAMAGSLRDRLARAVGDPTLLVGYSVDERRGEFVDESGAPIAPPSPAPGRVITPITIAGKHAAVIDHDAAVLDDPRLVSAIAAAVELALSNSALQAEILARVADVDASRERLVGAADAQRRRLERLLQVGAARRLGRVDELMTTLHVRRPGDPRLAEIRADLERAQTALGDLARGIHPAVLTTGGLIAALTDLVRRTPSNVNLLVADDAGATEIDPLAESTLYFVASEALANSAKHAGAKSITIDLHRSGTDLRLTVRDDGVGGADTGPRGGLRGLADRVEALGGRFLVDSPTGGGTRIVADLPHRRERLVETPRAGHGEGDAIAAARSSASGGSTNPAGRATGSVR